ncbi:hypothetical protein D3C78_1549640 [compost metagenome]
MSTPFTVFDSTRVCICPAKIAVSSGFAFAISVTPVPAFPFSLSSPICMRPTITSTLPFSSAIAFFVSSTGSFTIIPSKWSVPFSNSVIIGVFMPIMPTLTPAFSIMV